MTWYKSNTLRIFVPAIDPFGDNWVEQILGAVIKPIVDKYLNHISWLWITRYSNPYHVDKSSSGYLLPEQFCVDDCCRFVKFRLHADEIVRAELHQEVMQLAKSELCFPEPNGWILYNPIEDLGSNRFIRADATTEERSQRAKLIVFFMDATIRLMLNSLSCDDSGKWSLEPNELKEQNPNGSFFESAHHLFCNATGVPTTVLVSRQGKSLHIRTDWMPWILVPDNINNFKEVTVPIHY